MTIVQPRKMKRGDLAPELRVRIITADPAFDPQAIVSARVIGAHDGEVIFDRPAADIVTINGGVEVTMAFEAADTDQTGKIIVEVELMWPGGKPQTVRSDNFILISPDLA